MKASPRIFASKDFGMGNLSVRTSCSQPHAPPARSGKPQNSTEALPPGGTPSHSSGKSLLAASPRGRVVTPVRIQFMDAKASQVKLGVDACTDAAAGFRTRPDTLVASGGPPTWSDRRHWQFPPRILSDRHARFRFCSDSLPRAAPHPVEMLRARLPVRALLTTEPPPRSLCGASVRRHQTCEVREHATSAPAEFGWKYTMSREIEPVCRSFCRCGSHTFTEVARLVPSRLWPARGGRFSRRRFRRRVAQTPDVLLQSSKTTRLTGCDVMRK